MYKVSAVVYIHILIPVADYICFVTIITSLKKVASCFKQLATDKHS